MKHHDLLRSNILTRKKIDVKQCGVVQNVKGTFKADPLKTVNLG